MARYVLIDSTDVNTLYVSTGIFDREAANSDPDTRTAGGVSIVKSTDGGETWAEVNMQPDGVTTNFAPGRGGVEREYVFAARDGEEATVEAELIFRHAYYELIQQKDWDTPDILMESITVALARESSDQQYFEKQGLGH